MILYIGIVSLIMVATVSLSISLMNLRIKERAMASIQSNETRILARLSDAMRHASLVNTGTSTFLTDPGVLSLQMVDSSVNPTIFSLTADNGIFQVKEASGSNVPLTTSDVSVTNFTVTNLTSSSDTGIILVQMTISVSSSSTPLYAFSQSFETVLRVPLDN